LPRICKVQGTDYPAGAVFRYLETNQGDVHFYVQGEAGKDALDAKIASDNWPFKYETVAFVAGVYENNTCPTDTEQVYRYLNTTYGSIHFYVKGATEKAALDTKIADAGWPFKYETVAFCAYNDAVNGADPVYRFLNLRTGQTHFYILGDADATILRDRIKSGGIWEGAFKEETTAFYAMPAV
ncbi:MAG: hypothetical protein Q9M91_00005, partial [Candidatus Dojkabacteria bacterium]|nr:hypothetical protein [Candidatus Dojkabacteria bacterium]